MSSIFFFPPPAYVKDLNLGMSFPIEELCNRAGIPCLASGDWTKRRVEIQYGRNLLIEAEPGDWGVVRIVMKKATRKSEARLALLVLSYALHDLVAKQSIMGAPWAKVPVPRGRIRTGRALSNSERQRLFREKMR